MYAVASHTAWGVQLLSNKMKWGALWWPRASQYNSKLWAMISAWYFVAFNVPSHVLSAITKIQKETGLVDHLWHYTFRQMSYCFSHRFCLQCYTDIDGLWLPWYCPCSILTKWMTYWLNFEEWNRLIKYNLDWLDSVWWSVTMPLSITITKEKPIFEV